MDGISANPRKTASVNQAADEHQRRKPGRPKDNGDLRDVIADHAEQVFAEHGFAGARVRDISERAGVNQALIRYYFGSKRQLFDDVFRRRGRVLAGHRHVNLDALLDSGTILTVEDIVLAYLKPQWDMKYSGPGGAAFVRMQARLHAEPEEDALRLRREVYDASLHRYITVLTDTLPDIPEDIISMRMAFLVGTYLFMLNDLGRLQDLTSGHITDVGKDQMLNHLVAFLSAGLRAPVSL